MKKYIKPEMEITGFDFEDIMTTSSTSGSLIQKGINLGSVTYDGLNLDLTETNLFK